MPRKQEIDYDDEDLPSRYAPHIRHNQRRMVHAYDEGPSRYATHIQARLHTPVVPPAPPAPPVPKKSSLKKKATSPPKKTASPPKKTASPPKNREDPYLTGQTMTARRKAMGYASPSNSRSNSRSKSRSKSPNKAKASGGSSKKITRKASGGSPKKITRPVISASEFQQAAKRLKKPKTTSPPKRASTHSFQINDRYAKDADIAEGGEGTWDEYGFRDRVTAQRKRR
jgi:hypothetical protein